MSLNHDVIISSLAITDRHLNSDAFRIYCLLCSMKGKDIDLDDGTLPILTGLSSKVFHDNIELLIERQYLKKISEDEYELDCP